MSANLGFSNLYHITNVGNSKKAKFHTLWRPPGTGRARCNLGVMDANSGNIGRAVNQIAASGWALYDAMHELTVFYTKKVW